MKIIEFKLRHKLSFQFKQVISQKNDVIIFHSVINSTGKTTLLRAILYTLGFSVPDTELVAFKNYEFDMTVNVKSNTHHIVRKDALITVDDIEFDLPVDELAVRALLFNISNYELLDNLLGAIYFDQEKGWTLLNRGTIIGKNHFSIESFFRGLNDDESAAGYKLKDELSSIEKKIAQYKLIANVAEYKDAVNVAVSKSLSYDNFYEGIEKELIEKRQRLGIVESELRDINDIIKRNKTFIDYILRKKIYITDTHGEVIRVTKENLFRYDEVEESNEARKSMLLLERNAIRTRIAELESNQERQLTFDGFSSDEERLNYRLSELKDISIVEVQSILKRLEKEKERVAKKMVEHTRFNNSWIEKVNKIVTAYKEELHVPEKYKIDIFTHKLKSKSGAILHKLVFIYKLAYIKVLSQKAEYPMPIFCDSPSGREVEQETIKAMLNIIKRDFSDHQIIIASINDYKEIFNNSTIIPMNGTLFNQQSFLD